MSISQRVCDWLETHWINPSYGGWVLAAIATCFFGAATNTMVGWLYVLSGISFALLGLAAVLPVRSLRYLKLHRQQIQPVSVGDQLTIEITIENPTNQIKTLLQAKDIIPYVLENPLKGEMKASTNNKTNSSKNLPHITAIERIPAHDSYKWVYYLPTKQRGVYHWKTLEFRTGTPLGLFWCRRQKEFPAKAIVYPTVLPLISCPLVDEIGQDDNKQFLSRDRRHQMATEGITRALRPYRVGDPIRLIHWRTSARYGELKVRELEIFTGDQEVIICLDSATQWLSDDFEQAVIAAASLYFYACRAQMNVKLWTALTGLVHGNRVVLEALAATYYGQEPGQEPPPNLPLIWLTQNPTSLNNLPSGSRWVLWQSDASGNQAAPAHRNSVGMVINLEQSLQQQLQSPLSQLNSM